MRVLWLLCALALSVTFLATTTACPTPQQLYASRVDALDAYMNRTSGDLDQYLDVCERYYVDDSTLVVRGIGAHNGKLALVDFGFTLFGSLDGRSTSIGMKMAVDHSTLSWSTSPEAAALGDANDTVTFKVDYTHLMVKVPETGEWVLRIGGLRNIETIRFVPFGDQVLVDHLVFDLDVVPLYLDAHRTSARDLCNKIFSRCPCDILPYTSLDQCVAFMEALDASAAPNTDCPEPLISNTTACRDYHADAAWTDPDTHCPHTGVDSAMCVDKCLGACASCPVNAHCAVSYGSPPTTSSDRDATYSCVCNDVHVSLSVDASTGSATLCAPRPCVANWQCGGSVGSECSDDTGLCGCVPTFLWNATSGHCQCIDGTVRWEGGAPVCVPHGHCLERYHCHLQAWNRVQCSLSDPPNWLSPFKSCLCNPGFVGGIENACTCPHGNAAVVWSDRVQGEVCLAPGQCSADWHCVPGGVGRCVFASLNDPLGTCS
jgi:hypothetical protein